MFGKTDLATLPPELANELHETDRIVRSFLAGLSFIIKDTARDSSFRDEHLLSYLGQDILQSAISITSLATEGLLNVAKRELRFLLEASIKIAFVQQQSYRSSTREKIEAFDRELSSHKLTIKNNLRLGLLPEALRGSFVEEIGRINGLVSGYVHLTPQQMLESIAAADAGVTSGKERPEDVVALNVIVSRVMAASLVMLFHSVPGSIAGDWLVEPNGDTIDWYFVGSRFIAGMDSEFDYKHERQDRLDEIARLRAARITF